ncbi:MAG: 16S rRNA (cytidine(1402)-2'-O)-methyltransferase [Lachnospiraceae bacterium]|nr:16S rRNA (cytidine(1402)-2'-O)-methyltransferase [Lachnospiraceae bacterium]
MAGKLYVCATPIGNLEDITIRVIHTLKAVDIIAAEDTRHSRKLLTHFDIHTPLTSYHEHNKIEKAGRLVDMLLEGKNIAVVTDAGTPVISDPGEELVRQAVAAGIEVTSLPGACACITALTMSALSARRFSFEAFLPANKKARARILEELSTETRTTIIYEAPHHLKKTLLELREYLGNRPLTLCREITKKYEECIYTDIDSAIKMYEAEAPRGEYVLVVGGCDLNDKLESERSNFLSMTVNEHMDIYLSQGMDKKDAMRQVAKDRGVSRREIYNSLLE